MPVHHIRLKGPWEYEWLSSCAARSTEGEADETGGTNGRVQMPCDWRALFGERAGRARFTRVFHSPSGLEAGDSVRLVFAGVGGTLNAQLNGKLLVPASVDALNSVSSGLGSPVEQPRIAFEITSQLRGVNRLAVEVEFDPQAQTESPGGLFEMVTIEIESATTGSGD